jgi:hypothetical protein
LQKSNLSYVQIVKKNKVKNINTLIVGNVLE